MQQAGLRCRRTQTSSAGTDVNIHCSKEGFQLQDNIAAVLGSARAVCVFHEGMLASLEEFASRVAAAAEHRPREDDAIRIRWDELKSRIHIIPQAVHLPASPISNDFPSIQDATGLPADQAVVLLPAGIRPVKDVSYCMRAFATFNANSGETPLHLVVVGPILSPEEHSLVSATMATALDEASLPQPCVHLLPPVPREQLLVWMRSCVAVLNSSRSEGMPNAVMEAMALGVPVVVRRNSGNTSLVQHGKTGVVFDSPEEAVAACAACAGKTGRGATATADQDHPAAAVGAVVAASPLQMAAAGKADMEARFSCGAEAAAWVHLLQTA